MMKKMIVYPAVMVIVSFLVSACNSKPAVNTANPTSSPVSSSSAAPTYAYDFPTCQSRGNPIRETYPRSCQEGDQLFVENLDNEKEKQNLIQVTTSLQPTIKSPVTIEGKARGSWYFEGSFPIKLVDENKKVIGTTTAKAKGEWTTNDFVPFTAALTFKPNKLHGFATLILEKDNPSGLPANADQLVIPVSY